MRDIGPLFDNIRDLGVDGGETDARFPGEEGDTVRCLKEGDVALCDAEVAWCRRVGGAVAMAFALARLAAIAAATLVFFVVFGLTAGVKAVAASGSGQTFSSCFRAR